MDPNNMPDPFLSQYYGTNVPEPIEGDSLEKMAQLHLLEKLAEDEQIDLTQYSDEEILAMTDQVFGEGNGGYEPQYGDGDYEKIAAARFEEADYLGRVMAHSMWNELEAIQKAAARGGQMWEGGEAAGEKAWQEQTKKVKDLKSEAVSAAKERHWANKPSAAGKGYSGARSVGKAEGAARGALHKLKRPGAKGKAALVAGGAAALTGGAILGARALKKRQEQQKTASALDTLADSRAFDILAEYGYVTERGDVIPPDGEPGTPWDVPFQKTASVELDNAVEDLAWGKLYDLGYLG